MNLEQSYRIFHKIWISEYFCKITTTAITHSSHHVKATGFKTGKILTEKL